MKTMCPADYHHNGFVATHALGNMMYGLSNGDNREGTLFSRLHIYYAHLASVRFEHSVCRGSLMSVVVNYGSLWP